MQPDRTNAMQIAAAMVFMQVENRREPLGAAQRLFGDKTENFQIFGPDLPISGNKVGFHFFWVENDLCIQIQMALTVVIGVAEAQGVGAVRIGANFFHIAKMTGRHAAILVYAYDHERTGDWQIGGIAIFLGAIKPSDWAGIAQST